MKETDLFIPVKEWLEDKGWEVFAEVEGAGGVVDIVGRQHTAYCIVEMKTNLSHELIDQIMRRVGYAQYLYIAIPKRKKLLPRYIERLFKQKGIGILTVDQWSDGRYLVHDVYPAKYKKAHMLKRYDWSLRKEHKNFADAGIAGGKHWTPYKSTIADVKRYLENITRRFYRGKKVPDDRGGWRSIDEILEHCETHYARPKPSLSKSLREFESDWCESKKIKGKIHFRYAEEKVN